jgi:predicted nucleic acid-binding Zn ribbon protein
MEKKDIQKIDSLLDQFVKTNNLERGLAEYRLMKAWENLLGICIARKTKSMHIRNGKLFVTLHSSVVRNELSMMKETLISRLNEAAGMNVIKDIILK